MTEIIGYFLAIIVGISLGLVGSGGSILTLPILVYLLDVEPVLATAYSLFIVGVSAIFGSIKNATQKTIHYKIALYFGIPSIIAVYATRAYIVPNLPEVFFTNNDIVITKAMGLMILFAIIMILAAISMLKKQRLNTDLQENHPPKLNFFLVLLEGTLVGVLTGLVGAGGGFLIIPALVILAKLPIKNAVATSLVIIAAKSLIGFLGDVQKMPDIDYKFLFFFTFLSVLGIFIGIKLSQYISGAKLKRGFGWFVLIMGFYIFIKEIFV